MKRGLLYILFLLLTTYTYGQSIEEYWERWNNNYPEVDIISVLKHERIYADSVEKDLNIPQYYLRIDKYRFQAEYLGKTRTASEEVVASMKRVLKIFTGDSTQFDELIDKEVLFRVGQEEIWMPIQPIVLEALEEEVEIGDTIILYCLFLNEHTYDPNVLYNTFFISEFNY